MNRNICPECGGHYRRGFTKLGAPRVGAMVKYSESVSLDPDGKSFPFTDEDEIVKVDYEAKTIAVKLGVPYAIYPSRKIVGRKTIFGYYDGRAVGDNVDPSFNRIIKVLPLGD